MMPWFLVIDGPTSPGVNSSTEVGGELRGQTLLGQLDAISLDPRDGDFERVAIGPHRLDAHGLPWLGGRCDDRLGGEIERDAEHVGVFGGEKIFLV